MKSKKHKTAEEIIFREEVEYKWNIKRFRKEESVRTDDIEELIDIGFLNPEDCQNDSPTAQDLLELGRELEKKLGADTHVEYIGYIRSPEDNSPSRMMLTGFIISGEVPKEVRDEIHLIEGDEKEVSGDFVRLWWD